METHKPPLIEGVNLRTVDVRRQPVRVPLGSTGTTADAAHSLDACLAVDVVGDGAFPPCDSRLLATMEGTAEVVGTAWPRRPLLPPQPSMSGRIMATTPASWRPLDHPVDLHAVQQQQHWTANSCSPSLPPPWDGAYRDDSAACPWLMPGTSVSANTATPFRPGSGSQSSAPLIDREPDTGGTSTTFSGTTLAASGPGAQCLQLSQQHPPVQPRSTTSGSPTRVLSVLAPPCSTAGLQASNAPAACWVAWSSDNELPSIPTGSAGHRASELSAQSPLADGLSWGQASSITRPGQPIAPWPEMELSTAALPPPAPQGECRGRYLGPSPAAARPITCPHAGVAMPVQPSSAGAGAVGFGSLAHWVRPGPLPALPPRTTIWADGGAEVWREAFGE